MRMRRITGEAQGSSGSACSSAFSANAAEATLEGDPEVVGHLGRQTKMERGVVYRVHDDGEDEPVPEAPVAGDLLPVPSTLLTTHGGGGGAAFPAQSPSNFRPSTRTLHSPRRVEQRAGVTLVAVGTPWYRKQLNSYPRSSDIVSSAHARPSPPHSTPGRARKKKRRAP